MWGSPAVAWAFCLACVQPVVFPWILPFRSNRDRPSPAPEVSTEVSPDEVECFSDYMTLWIPRSHVEGLRQWLGRILHLPGAWRAPDSLDSFLAKCGYFLHPAPDGDFVFRAQYSACFVQKEKANYRLEIRISQKGVTRLERSDHYIMKCPVLTSGLGQETVHCGPTFIQVSRPLPLWSDSGQTPWLLSLQGELVASLEDASLMGLYVDINATTVTVQSPRQNLLQRWEVLNTSAELLPLWLVSGHYAYSLQAACPPVSSQPESEVLVHIPKQRLGLVKRGSRIKETLSLKFVRVHGSNTFTVTENRDFVMVSIPVAEVLQVQRCQEGQGAPGTQAFYRVDLSLEFVEMATPVLWTLESFFQCVGSGTELPASTATPRTTLPSRSPGPKTPPAGIPLVASPQFSAAGPAAQEGLWCPGHQPCTGLAKKKPGPSLQTDQPVGRSWTFTASLVPRATRDQSGPQAPEEVGLPGHPSPSATLPLESTGGGQAGPRAPHPVFPGPPALTVALSSELSSPQLPPRRSERSKVFLVSKPSVTLEGLETVRPEQDPSQPAGSPLVPKELSVGDAAATEPVPGEAEQPREEVQPVQRPLSASLTEEALVSHHYPRQPQETAFVMEVDGPPHRGPGLPGEGARGRLDLLSSEPSPGTEGLGLTILLEREATFVTPEVRQSDPSAHGGALRPEPTGWHRAVPAVPLAVLTAEQLPAEPSHPTALPKPKASSRGGSDRAQSLEPAPGSLGGQDEWGAAHTSSPLSTQTQSLGAPTEASSPSLAELGHPFPAGQGTSPQQGPTDPTLASSPESHRPLELLNSVEGLSERPPCW
uniref:Chromosome 1 open reading frame 127 n=1 Tax=Prolemur simus TaxID=1328070 RepID=A0A8C9ALI1_PROSS